MLRFKKPYLPNMENHERHFSRTTILQVGAKQIEDNDRDKKSA